MPVVCQGQRPGPFAAVPVVCQGRHNCMPAQACVASSAAPSCSASSTMTTPAYAIIHAQSPPLHLSAALFICNRVVDVSFIIDMVLQALMGYWDKKRQRWETSLGPVQWRYCRTWLLLDVISAAPFDVVAMLLSSQTLSKFKVRLGPQGVS